MKFPQDEKVKFAVGLMALVVILYRVVTVAWPTIQKGGISNFLVAFTQLV